MALVGDFIENRADAAPGGIADDVDASFVVSSMDFTVPHSGAQSLVTSASMPYVSRARRIVQHGGPHHQ